jgi:hypothetical protein
VDREPGSQLIWKDRKPFDRSAIRGQANVFGEDGHNLFMLARKDFTEPADRACQRQHGTQTAD